MVLFYSCQQLTTNSEHVLIGLALPAGEGLRETKIALAIAACCCDDDISTFFYRRCPRCLRVFLCAFEHASSALASGIASTFFHPSVANSGRATDMAG